jgi:hypothetical protein
MSLFLSPASLLVGSLTIMLVGMLLYLGPDASDTVVGACVAIGLLMLRPGLIGEWVAPVGVVLLGSVLVTSGARHRQVPGSQRTALMLLLPFLVIANRSGGTLAMLSGLVVTPVVMLSGQDVGRRIGAVRIIVRIFAVIAAWQSIALVISQAAGLSSYSISRGSGDRAGWTYTLSGLGSLSTGSGGVGRLVNERLTGPYGEPGCLAGVLACVAALELITERRWRPVIQVPLVFGIVLTQSIAGMGAYVAALLVWVTLKRLPTLRHSSARDLMVAVAGVGLCIVLLTSTSILEAKSEASGASVSDRLGGISLAGLLSSWVSDPLGTSGGNSINLIRTSVTLGPLALAVGLWYFLAPISGKRGRVVAPLVVAYMLTVLFAQPPFLYSWVFFAGVAGALAMVEPQAPRTQHSQRGLALQRPQDVAPELL